MSQAESVGAARVFSQCPERLATLWRRERLAQPAGRGPLPLLDGVIESFTRELGRTLAGERGHPWTRTSGVLRLSLARGAQALYDEFATFRRILLDAIDALGGTASQRRLVNAAIDDAVDSAVTLLHQLQDGPSSEVRTPFGGLVVELYERAPEPAPRAAAAPIESAPVH